jgi:3-oxoacyl-[acyl-carrier protein] reductase
MDLGLVGKAVLVTGGSQGIGRGVAEEFAREGARVAICARGKNGLDEAREALEAHGAEMIAITADMSQADDAERVVEAAAGGFGRLDVLVNNAGGGSLGHTLETTDDEWAASMDANLYSAVRATRAAVPHLRAAGGGRIVNISSAAGHTVVMPGVVDYSTAKAGMLAFSKLMALELAPDNILVNAVCPSLIHTPMMERVADSLIGTAGATRDEVFTNFATQTQMLARIGTVEEVAALVVFLASARASFITGSVYNVDGGLTKSIH